MNIQKLLNRYDIRVFIITALAILTLVAGFFIYADPTGKITGRPEKVEHFRVEDASYDSISLKWDRSPRAVDYTLYRSEDKRSGYEAIKTVSGTEYTDEELMTGKTYWYRVVASSDRRKSGKSKKVSAKPKLEMPRMTARSTGDGVVIKITEVPGADGYEIYRDKELIAKGDGLEYLDDDTKAKERARYTAKAYREIEDKVVDSPVSKARVASKISLSISLKDYEEIPELLAGDDSFAIKGHIKSNATIKKIEAGVKKEESDEWLSQETKYEESGINEKNYDITSVNESIAMDSLPAGRYKFVVMAELKDGTVKTLKDQEFSVREPSGGELIAKVATECAWPYGTPKSKYKYSGGQPTEAYRKALDQAYGSRSGWGKQTRAGASCDVFVGTVVRVAGVDSGYPRGLDGVVSHCNKNTDKWEQLEDKSEANLRPGDVIFQIFNGGGGHTCVYLGDGMVAQAHFISNGGTYGEISKYSHAVMSASRCKQYYVYRSKQ